MKDKKESSLHLIFQPISFEAVKYNKSHDIGIPSKLLYLLQSVSLDLNWYASLIC